MNSKKCKALRKALKNLEAYQPEKLKGDCIYVEDKTKRKIITIKDLDKNGELVDKQVSISAGQVSVTPDSKRGLYKTFKKNLSQMERSHA